MKFLLTPITVIFWFLITYLGIYYGLLLMHWMFSLGWIWLILGYAFLIGIISGLVVTIPGLLNILILKLYGLNWFTVAVHSLAGLIGFLYFYNQGPLELEVGSESVPLLKGLWQQSWLKTILLIIPFFGIQIGLFYSAVIAPVRLKLESTKKLRSAY